MSSMLELLLSLRPLSFPTYHPNLVFVLDIEPGPNIILPYKLRIGTRSGYEKCFKVFLFPNK